MRLVRETMPTEAHTALALAAAAGLTRTHDIAAAAGCHRMTVLHWTAEESLAHRGRPNKRIGARPMPAVLTALRRLIQRQRAAAAEIVRQVRHAGRARVITVAVPRDDAAAIALGWPCAAAAHHVAALAAARLPGVYLKVVAAGVEEK